MFGWLAWRSGSIWPGVGAHAANNLVSTLLFLLSHDAPEDDGSPAAIGLMALLGCLALAGVFQLGRKFPSLLDSRSPAVTTPGPRLNVVAAVGGWVLVAGLSHALVLGLDWRGAQLGWIDATVPLQFKDKHDPDQDALLKLRAEARAGQVPVDDYRELRRRLRLTQTKH